jgi:hypothetical protein
VIPEISVGIYRFDFYIKNFYEVDLEKVDYLAVSEKYQNWKKDEVN